MADGRRDGPRLWDQVRKLIRIRRGKSNREIGEILTISPRTMKMTKHLEHIFEKLGVENRASAAARAVRTLARG